MLSALVVEDDAQSRSALAELIESEGFETATVANLEEARAALEAEIPDVVLADLILPDGKGIELLELLDGEPGVEVILVTGKATVETAVEALRRGAFDYLTKPIDLPRLKSLLGHVKGTHELRREVSSLRAELRELGRFGPLVGTSEAMQEVYDLIDKVAPTETTVFLIGESGTGKELAAQTVHRLSKRRNGVFLPLNCGAISPNLIESELFGHEKGSFTGASRQHQGYFERTSGGTLLLDEITEMPPELQVKLLRVLETGRLIRVGGTREIEVDVRVVAATNAIPEEAIEEGKLRRDLYYRLKVFPIHLPPLRERDDDIETLARHFVNELNKQAEVNKRLTDEAIRQLRAHSWPGNVRELKNAIERAFILAEERITPKTLPVDVNNGSGVGTGPLVHLKVGTDLDEVERRMILATLSDLDGDKKEAAKRLGISLKTLYNRLNRYESEEQEA